MLQYNKTAVSRIPVTISGSVGPDFLFAPWCSQAYQTDETKKNFHTKWDPAKPGYNTSITSKAMYLIEDGWFASKAALGGKEFDRNGAAIFGEKLGNIIFDHKFVKILSKMYLEYAHSRCMTVRVWLPIPAPLAPGPPWLSSRSAMPLVNLLSVCPSGLSDGTHLPPQHRERGDRSGREAGVRTDAENASYSKRSAALSSASLKLSFEYVMDPTLARTISKGERPAHRTDACSSL